MHQINKHEKQSGAHDINAGMEGERAVDYKLLRSCSPPERPPFVPMLCEAVMTLFNEYVLPLLTGEENTQAFSSLTNAGVDVETDILYHMWEMDLDNCRIYMT